MPSTPQQIAPSSNTYLDAIQWGGWRWNDAPAGTDITYWFGGAGQNLFLRLGVGTSVAWTESERTDYRDALQTWADVANITFTEASSQAEADLVEWVYNGSGSLLGLHETPEDANGPDGQAWGAYNRGGFGWNTDGLAPGGYGYITLVHELGHGLGLAHPHDDGGGSGFFPGVTPFDSSDTGDNDLNQGIFTTMSYNDGWETGPSGNQFSAAFGWQSGPMAFDIAAIQFLYGANMAFNAGNNTYTLPDVEAAGTFWSCIWDTGGTDEIVYNGSLDTVINLTAATLDNSPTGGGAPSYASGIHGGFTIANGVVVENATGGSGADTITGNSSNNVLRGSLGNDTIDGGLGTDNAVFSGMRSAYTLTALTGTGVLVIGPDGFDTLSNIERLVFDDMAVTWPLGPVTSWNTWTTGASSTDQGADTNGDGRADLVQFYDGRAYVALSTGASFGTWMVAASGVTSTDQLADFNGDGREDLLQSYQGRIYVALSNGSTFDAWNVWGTGSTPTDQGADVNGDGRADLVQLYNGRALVALSSGADFGAWADWTTGITSNDELADFNGDGRDDLFQIYQGRSYVALSNGSAFGEWSNWGTASLPTDQAADVNADGRADLVQFYNGTAYVALSTGSGFGNWIERATGVTSNDRLADVNGDSRDDILQLYQDRALVALATSDGFGREHDMTTVDNDLAAIFGHDPVPQPPPEVDQLQNSAVQTAPLNGFLL